MSSRSIALGARPRGLLAAIGAAVLLVAARSAVYVHYPQSFFDSDQAIIGLMAKHLDEGRAFPLFYYGLSYLMAVDAWIAAAVFLVTGPTVGALHASVVLTNMAVVVLLIVGLCRSMSLSPWAALGASIVVVFAPPLTAALLIAAGGNIDPFLWVLLLWFVRDRPLWFGATLAFGFENREFTIYAVPALLLVQLLEGTLLRLSTLRAWLLVLVAFFATWQTIETLRPFGSPLGPGTRGTLVGSAANSQMGNLSERMSLVPRELPGRAEAMLADHIPRLLGGRFIDDPVASQGHDWMRWPLMGVLLAAGIRTLMLMVRTPTLWHAPGSPLGFGWYLTAIGVVAACAYAAARPADELIERYLLLTIFIAVGIVALFFAAERRPAARRGFAALLLVWTVLSGCDHLRLAERYMRGQEPDDMQMLADRLVARHILVAEANYWRAYKLAFVSREQVKVASTDVVRIQEYQDLAAAAGSSLVRIQETPCEAPETIPADTIGPWYLCHDGP